MRRILSAIVVILAVAVAFLAVRGVRLQADPSVGAVRVHADHRFEAGHALEADHGSLIERDADVARREPGTHNGGGETTGYSFFAKASNPALVFRKRALHAGSAIGPHKQEVDEVYYVLSGSGELTLDGEQHTIGPGTAILTRPGSSHSLKQTGTQDLVIIIAYPPEKR